MKTQLEWWLAIMAARKEGLSGWEEALLNAYWEEFGHEKAHAG